MDQIVQLISNVGFPIACCIILFMQQSKLTKTLESIGTTMALMQQDLGDLKQDLNGLEQKINGR